MPLTDEWQGEPLPFQNKHTGHVYSIGVYKNLLPFINVKKRHKVMVGEMTGKTAHQKYLPGKTLSMRNFAASALKQTNQNQSLHQGFKPFARRCWHPQHLDLHKFFPASTKHHELRPQCIYPSAETAAFPYCPALLARHRSPTSQHKA